MVKNAFLQLRYLFNSVKFVFRYKNLKSYYPDHPQHGKMKMVLDNYRWACNNGTVNNHYFLYGMDRNGAGIEIEKYLSYREHMDILNNKLVKSNELKKIHECTENKLQFCRLARELGFQTPEIIARITDGIVYPSNTQEEIGIIDYFCSLNEKEIFCKPVSGTKGGGIFSLKLFNNELFKNDISISVSDLPEIFAGSVYLLQEPVGQHPQLKNIHAASLNTMRLITIWQDGRARPFVATLRMGTGGATADNWRFGGLVVRVDIDRGTLTGNALPEPGKGPALSRHPDSGIEFEGYPIPYYNKALNEACVFHEKLGNVPSVAWDIAFEEGSVCFIEANIEWGNRTHLLLEPDFKMRFRNSFIDRI